MRLDSNSPLSLLRLSAGCGGSATVLRRRGSGKQVPRAFPSASAESSRGRGCHSLWPKNCFHRRTGLRAPLSGRTRGKVPGTLAASLLPVYVLSSGLVPTAAPSAERGPQGATAGLGPLEIQGRFGQLLTSKQRRWLSLPTPETQPGARLPLPSPPGFSVSHTHISPPGRSPCCSLCPDHVSLAPPTSLLLPGELPPSAGRAGPGYPGRPVLPAHHQGTAPSACCPCGGDDLFPCLPHCGQGLLASRDLCG